MRGQLRSRLHGAHVAHAARVAGVATALIAVVVVVVAGALDAFVARRVLWEVDQRLSARLAEVSHLANPHANLSVPDDVGTDGAPVYVWFVSGDGRVEALTEQSPRLPVAAGAVLGTPRSVTVGSVTYRVEAARAHGGRLVAAQDLAGPSHIDAVLLIGEIVLGPVLLVAVFVGSLVIALQAVAPVEEARRRLQEFTADASHELRTPLTVIGAEVELARGAPERGEDVGDALERVGHETRRLGRIVEDLLWLARFDAGARPGATPPGGGDGTGPRRTRPGAEGSGAGEPCELGAVVARCAERFTSVAAARAMDLEIDVPSDAVWVAGDADWLDRLTGTLLDNACRYAPAGGHVRVRVRSSGSRAVLVVDDDGPGIPEAARPRLFDRFRRATDVPGGAGLGLAIADSVVRSTGGRWRIGTSELGGASVEVSWRLAPGPAAAGRA